jgi:choline-sulfatase
VVPLKDKNDGFEDTYMIKRPNIVFILSDQHSPRFLGSLYPQLIDTPNLDRLCSQGVRLENTYCQNPLCVPSRASLLTGKYSKNLGIYENRHILESNSQTLPRYFSGAGYRTCIVGKAHFNGDQWQGYQQRPYGDLFGQAHQSEYIRTGKPPESEHGLEDLLDNSGPTSIPLPLTQTEICVSESVKWLQHQVDTSAGQPFLLSINFDKPHFPYRPPKKYFDKYINRVTLPQYPEDYANKMAVEFVQKAFQINGGWEHYGIDMDVHRRALAAYCGCVEWIDDAIGRILDSLEYLGLAQDTIVIYASDHGEMAARMGAWQKTVFFDDSAKVPFIIRWPGHISAGTTTKTLAGLIDLIPTLCEFAQIPIPVECDGVSLAQHLLTGSPSARNFIFSESVVLKTPEHAGCMLRDERYKYNFYLQGRHELYDMQLDPQELYNRIDDPALSHVAKDMNQRIVEFWNPDQQIERYTRCPMMGHEKHFYLYSNQFASSGGEIFNARP